VAEREREQRRGRTIAMSAGDIDRFLADARTCRVATVGPDGPHATPLWFVWVDGRLWLYSITRSQRWADLTRDPRISAVIDDGLEYRQLRGVEIVGAAEVVGAVPRLPGTDPGAELAACEQAFAAKYFAGSDRMDHDGRHGWLRVVPRKIVSWDFRKIPAR
jgi:hypothetical protein